MRSTIKRGLRTKRIRLSEARKAARSVRLAAGLQEPLSPALEQALHPRLGQQAPVPSCLVQLDFSGEPISQTLVWTSLGWCKRERGD